VFLLGPIYAVPVFAPLYVSSISCIRKRPCHPKAGIGLSFLWYFTIYNLLELIETEKTY
jgi:hypothetical protein